MGSELGDGLADVLFGKTKQGVDGGGKTTNAEPPIEEDDAQAGGAEQVVEIVGCQEELPVEGGGTAAKLGIGEGQAICWYGRVQRRHPQGSGPNTTRYRTKPGPAPNSASGQELG